MLFYQIISFYSRIVRDTLKNIRTFAMSKENNNNLNLVATVIQHFVMKTYNGKTISKNNLQSVLRTMDATQIFRLVHIIYGGKVTRSQVYDFIKDYAPNMKIWNKAWELSHSQKHNEQRNAWNNPWKSIQFREQNAKHYAIQCLRENIARGIDSYSKRPMMGHTHLYFCSPVYGHRDYNKWQAMDIKGNEKFCETICKLADKYFSITK